MGMASMRLSKLSCMRMNLRVASKCVFAGSNQNLKYSKVSFLVILFLFFSFLFLSRSNLFFCTYLYICCLSYEVVSCMNLSCEFTDVLNEVIGC